MMKSHGVRVGIFLGLVGLTACDAEQLSFGLEREAGSSDDSEQTGTSRPEDGDGAASDTSEHEAGVSDASAPETEPQDPADAGDPDLNDAATEVTDPDPVGTCEQDEDCDDGNACNGEELCIDEVCYSGERAANGTACELEGKDDWLLCVEGNCIASHCGDGIVDPRTDEECDDGNGIDGDGCEVGCTYSCSNDEHCGDGNVCNGTERCDEELHACVGGRPAEDGTSCGSNRECNAGRCIQIGCGNGVLDEELGEECDDGNLDDADGCDSDCTWTCTSDEECDDSNVCNGAETCDLERNICIPGTNLVCDDRSDCTENLCDPLSGCYYPVIDGDGDGYASVALGACGTDCNDGDATIYAGAPELCDEKDNNCDGVIDETAPHWYVDCDGDGYAVAGDPGVQDCAMPGAPQVCGAGSAATWTAVAPTSGFADCHDGNLNMRPRLTQAENDAAWNTTGDGIRPAGQRFDYNCSGADEQRWTKAGVSPTGTCNLIIIGPISPTPIGPIASIELSPQQLINPGLLGTECGNNNGWTGDKAPACGTQAEYSRCLRYSTDGPCERASPFSRTQSCR